MLNHAHMAPIRCRHLVFGPQRTANPLLMLVSRRPEFLRATNGRQ